MKETMGGKRGVAAAKLPVATDDEVDEASQDSFPASDPPGWSGMRIGPPESSGHPASRRSPAQNNVTHGRKTSSP